MDKPSRCLVKWGGYLFFFAVGFYFAGIGVEAAFGQSIIDPVTGMTRPGSFPAIVQMFLGLGFFVFPCVGVPGVIAVILGVVIGAFEPKRSKTEENPPRPEEREGKGSSTQP